MHTVLLVEGVFVSFEVRGRCVIRDARNLCVVRTVKFPDVFSSQFPTSASCVSGCVVAFFAGAMLKLEDPFLEFIRIPQRGLVAGTCIGGSTDKLWPQPHAFSRPVVAAVIGTDVRVVDVWSNKELFHVPVPGIADVQAVHAMGLHDHLDILLVHRKSLTRLRLRRMNDEFSCARTTIARAHQSIEFVSMGPSHIVFGTPRALWVSRDHRGWSPIEGLPRAGVCAVGWLSSRLVAIEEGGQLWGTDLSGPMTPLTNFEGAIRAFGSTALGAVCVLQDSSVKLAELSGYAESTLDSSSDGAIAVEESPMMQSIPCSLDHVSFLESECEQRRRLVYEERGEFLAAVTSLLCLQIAQRRRDEQLWQDQTKSLENQVRQLEESLQRQSKLRCSLEQDLDRNQQYVADLREQRIEMTRSLENSEVLALDEIAHTARASIALAESSARTELLHLAFHRVSMENCELQVASAEAERQRRSLVEVVSELRSAVESHKVQRDTLATEARNCAIALSDCQIQLGEEREAAMQQSKRATQLCERLRQLEAEVHSLREENALGDKRANSATRIADEAVALSESRHEIGEGWKAIATSCVDSLRCFAAHIDSSMVEKAVPQAVMESRTMLRDIAFAVADLRRQLPPSTSELLHSVFDQVQVLQRVLQEDPEYVSLSREECIRFSLRTRGVLQASQLYQS